jgi:hypothetical protein
MRHKVDGQCFVHAEQLPITFSAVIIGTSHSTCKAQESQKPTSAKIWTLSNQSLKAYPLEQKVRTHMQKWNPLKLELSIPTREHTSQIKPLFSDKAHCTLFHSAERDPHM